jgi:hypothetical protein
MEVLAGVEVSRAQRRRRNDDVSAAAVGFKGVARVEVSFRVFFQRAISSGP